MIHRDARVAEGAVRRMADSMHLRGPDDEGIVVAEAGAGFQIAIGSRRLAIIDRSAAGHQPMVDESTGVAIAYNGMTYNFRTLRHGLEARGVVFRSSSDTEVVLRGYLEHGSDFIQQLDGMFGVALWDPRVKRLLLGRDRFGIKPLYYTVTKEGFAFASQVRSLLLSGLIDLRPSAAGLQAFFGTGAAADPQSVVDGVLAVPAGSLMIAGPGSPPRVSTFWQPMWAANPAPRSQASSELRQHLEDAVSTHMVSDVATGVFLSGGVDSSVITALAASRPGYVRTLSVVFPEAEYSEARYSRLVADACHTEHSERELSGTDFANCLPSAIRAMDQPTFDGVNTFVVAGAARDAGLTVVLSGLGADELFDGYGMRERVSRLTRAVRLPAPGRRALAAMSSGVGGRRSEKLRAWMEHPGGVGEAHALLRSLFLPDEVSALMDRAVDPPSPGTSDGEFGLPWLEMSTYMRNVLLRDSDFMSMAHSVELRVPFLDGGLVDFVMRLPESVRGPRKSLLLDACKGLLPPIVYARKKQGFALPMSRWLRTTLADEVNQRIRVVPGQLQGLVSGNVATAVWEDWSQHGGSWLRPWALAALFLWWDDVTTQLMAAR